MSLCSFEGESGRHYDYFALDFRSRAAFPIGGGNFVLTRRAGSVLEVICAGETDNVWTFFMSQVWDMAKRQYGAITPYIHANPDGEARRRESDDIIRKYHPPMNEELENPEQPRDAEVPEVATDVGNA